MPHDEPEKKHEHGPNCDHDHAPGHHHGPARQTPIRNEAPKTGRNESCPCGSGKKFKACHGKP